MHDGDSVCTEEGCGCGRPVEWLTPDRRDQLRRGACPGNDFEKRYQNGVFAHRAERARAEDNRG